MRADLAGSPPPSREPSATRTHADEFFYAVASAFARAAAGAPCHTRAYRIGEEIVRMEFAGAELVPTFTRALEHLRVSPDLTPALTIGFWEIESTGVLLPPPPWALNAYSPRGEILDFSDAENVTAFHTDGRVLFVYNLRAAHAYVAVFNHATLPAYERAAPVRPLFPRFLETQGIQYLHAAAVGLPEGGVLLAGKSGSGKSTTALACLDSDLNFAGDDYCAARFDGVPTVYSLYSSGKGDAKTIAHLPFLGPLIANRETIQQERAIWFLAEHFGARILSQFPLRAIVLPHVTAQSDTTLERASSQAALLALAPTTLSQLPNAGRDVFQHIAALSRRVPVFYLNVGSDMSQIPQTILRLLSELNP